MIKEEIKIFHSKQKLKKLMTAKKISADET
jgi:hypothetical protein